VSDSLSPEAQARSVATLWRAGWGRYVLAGLVAAASFGAGWVKGLIDASEKLRELRTAVAAVAESQQRVEAHVDELAKLKPSIAAAHRAALIATGCALSHETAATATAKLEDARQQLGAAFDARVAQGKEAEAAAGEVLSDVALTRARR
jgi:hypothetical protein